MSKSLSQIKAEFAQKTLAGPAMCAGIGLHSGAPCRLRFLPARADTGITFTRHDLNLKNVSVKAEADAVTELKLGTTITNQDGVSVATIEHLMAALSGLGIDNLHIEMDGPEIPILDGSSLLFTQLFLEVGLRELDVAQNLIRVINPIEIRDGNKWARFEPLKAGETGCYFDIRIDFPNQAIGEQTFQFHLRGSAFAEHLANARTFGFLAEVDALRKIGLARGGSLDNAVVLNDEGIMNPEGLRSADEFVRHKLLDAVGDLALAGGRIYGRYSANLPGHEMNNRLLRALLADSQSFERIRAGMDVLKSSAKTRNRKPHAANDWHTEASSQLAIH